MIDPVIYKIRNKHNGKLYFGQTIDFDRRMREYRFRKYEGSSKYHIIDVLNQEGIDNFTFEIVEHCELSELDEREAYYIKKHNTTNPLCGYNSQNGNLKRSCCLRTKRKMSESHIGLKEKASTKKKKSNPIYAINSNEFIIADSAKLFGDYIGKSKDIVSHALNQPHNLLGYYVFHQNKEKCSKIINKVKRNSSYIEYSKIINSSVETIEKSHKVIYLTYKDEVE